MHKKTEVEMERERITKITRTLVRLKHSLKADAELNQLLPATLDEFDESLQKGELRTLESSLISELLGD
jgi:hypothetical protein